MKTEDKELVTRAPENRLVFPESSLNEIESATGRIRDKTTEFRTSFMPERMKAVVGPGGVMAGAKTVDQRFDCNRAVSALACRKRRVSRDV